LTAGQTVSKGTPHIENKKKVGALVPAFFDEYLTLYVPSYSISPTTRSVFIWRFGSAQFINIIHES
jgi:hypothetical protein